MFKYKYVFIPKTFISYRFIVLYYVFIFIVAIRSATLFPRGALRLRQGGRTDCSTIETSLVDIYD